MAIATLDGVLAGMQPVRTIAKAATGALVANNLGKGFSTWATAGGPGAGSYNNTLNGVTLSSSSTIPNGAIPHVDPVSGNAYLARLSATASQSCIVMLCDRLWHNGGFTITSTAAQAITSPTWPARDAAGTTNGDGVMLALEVSAAVGAAAPTVTISYTNQAGTSGRTATNLDATHNSAIVGTTYRIGLQAGDTGVQSVQSLTLSASQVSGTINLVAYRLLAAMEIPGANIPNAIDALTSGFPRLWDGVVPYLMFVPSTAAALTLSGSYTETQG